MWKLQHHTTVTKITYISKFINKNKELFLRIIIDINSQYKNVWHNILLILSLKKKKKKTIEFRYIICPRYDIWRDKMQRRFKIMQPRKEVTKEPDDVPRIPYRTGAEGLFQRYRKNVIYAGQHQATEALSLFTCGKSPTGPNPGPRLEPW